MDFFVKRFANIDIFYIKPIIIIITDFMFILYKIFLKKSIGDILFIFKLCSIYFKNNLFTINIIYLLTR